MAGYIIELYKYKNIISDYKPLDSNKKGLRNNDYIAFGDFDRMAISKTTAFSRMRDMSELSRTWIGDRQTILLYELSKENAVVYENTDDDRGFYIFSRDGRKKSEALFIGITILQFRNSPIEANTNATKYINACREEILNIVNSEERDIHCSVFGVLGSYGVAIMWVADQYTEILELINTIKGADIKPDCKQQISGYPYLSVYTIFAKNNISDNILNSKKNQINGKAMLRLTLQSNLNKEIYSRVKENLGNISQFQSVGEHDLLIVTDTKIIYGLFEKNAVLNRNSDFYKRYFLQTNTKLCREIMNVEELKDREIILEDSKKENQLKDEIYDCYKKLRLLFFENFPKTAGMVDSLDLLYGDYLSKIATVSNKMWTADFKYQFYTILELIQKNLRKLTNHETNLKITAIEALEDIRDILNCFEYQIIHIAESNNLVLETPKCHLRYTGQNNLTLYTYFGIVKDILKLIYHLQYMSKQPEIVPLISVDMVPIIESFLYVEYDNCCDKEILKLNLPMMALYNIPIYAPYLYHEIFHYAVPKDRIVRNWYKGNVILILAMKNLVLELLYSYCEIKDMKILSALLNNVLSSYIYLSVMKMRYSEIPQILKQEKGHNLTIGEINSTNSNNDLLENVIKETGCTWKQYMKLLLQRIYKNIENVDEISLNRNLVYCVLTDFYKNKDNILKYTEKWIKKEENILDGYGNDIIIFMKSFMDRLNPIVNNIDGKKSEAYQSLIKSTNTKKSKLINLDKLDEVSNSLNEAICDVAMVELAEMGVSEYLLSYVKIQNDLLKSMDTNPQYQDVIRIGIVIDKIHGFDETSENNIVNLKSVKNDFVNLYIGLYFSIHTFGQMEHSDYLDVLLKDAQTWFDKIVNWYEQYTAMYRFYIGMFDTIINQYSTKTRFNSNNTINNYFSQLKCKEYYQAMKNYGNSIRIAVDNKEIVLFEDKLKVIKEARRVFRSSTFGMNIQIIQKYQEQQDFIEINEICKDSFKKDELYKMEINKLDPEFINHYQSNLVIKKKSGELETANYTYSINGIEDLCRAIENVSIFFAKRDKELYTDKVHNLWYRGHESTKYKLLPSAMRKFKDIVNNAKDLRTYQKAAYEEFKFRLDDASEVISTSSYTVCDFLALMQHYGVPTIYLDWSENAITALYFALEAYIDPKKSMEKNSEDAVLYIMHPNLYNRARNMLMNTVKWNSGRALEKDMMATIQNKTEALPNLSVAYNKNRYYMFLLDEIDENKIPDYPKADVGLEKGSGAMLYLPLAIYSSRANMRIRNQHGMFMAYNIFTPPDKQVNFDYMELDEIQKVYLKICKNETPFMYKIIIKNDVKQQIADWLKAIGLTKDMVYPELSNISERI